MNRGIVRTAVLIVVVFVLWGALWGVLWWWLAPTLELEAEGDLVRLAPGSSFEDVFAADGWFWFLGLAAGLGCGVLGWLLERRRGVVLVVVVAIASCAATLTMWRVGQALGGGSSGGSDLLRRQPLELRAKAALLSWPAAAMFAFLLVDLLWGTPNSAQSPSSVRSAPGSFPPPVGMETGT